ncbi:MAG: ribbon-helix-helix domain-containing protein [Promethearchaeota archaeon]
MKLVTLHLPDTYIQDLEKLVQQKRYPNRSEAIRVAVRDLLKSEAWSTG